VANEKYMPWTMVINVFVVVVLAANFEVKKHIAVSAHFQPNYLA
jgi:hypothetical protein